MSEQNDSTPDARTRCGGPSSFLAITLGLMLLVPSPFWAVDSLRQVPAVMHVHSTWSSGDLPLDELIDRAHAVGVEAIFLTENHLLRYEYGLPPLRNILRYRVEYPSLLSRGPEAFLRAVEEANARQKNVLLIPGAQIIPHYYWTGSLLQRTLTMHDTQKDILALGLYRAEDYWSLPAAGNPGAARGSPASLRLLWPVALLVAGAWLLRIRWRRPIRLQYFKITVPRRYNGYGVLCLVIATLLLANDFPFRLPPFSPYDPNAGLRPHQAVIDFVNSHGGASVWSLPEARDHQEVNVAGMQATISTDPYPSDLLHTDRFTAFGGLYEDTTTFTDPRGGWDQLLADYLGGRRTAPTWAIGEAAYHSEGHAGKRFGTVQTVFLVDRMTPATLIEALRAGRFYALQRSPEAGLVLDQFQVLRPGYPPAEAGNRIMLRRDDRPEVRTAIHATGGKPLAVQALLVRNGIVVDSIRGETPVALNWSEPVLPAGSSLFYRIEVRGPSGHRILSNPIFLQSTRE